MPQKNTYTVHVTRGLDDLVVLHDPTNHNVVIIINNMQASTAEEVVITREETRRLCLWLTKDFEPGEVPA